MIPTRNARGHGGRLRAAPLPRVPSSSPALTPALSSDAPQGRTLAASPCQTLASSAYRSPPPSRARAQGMLPRMLAFAACLALAACADITLPGGLSVPGFGTAQDPAVRPTAERPEPDARGVISYPTYQVAVARPGDTVTTVAGRLGIDAADLARTNGLGLDAPLREGELVLLTERVAPVAAAPVIDPEGEIDVATIAGSALDRAEGTAPASAAPAANPPVGPEPRRHVVQRGETAFSIARRYEVSVQALASWNGLDSALTVREGQTLLIPVATGPAPAAEDATPEPGAGSPTPEPPSASTPQPAEDLPSTAETASAGAAAAGGAAAGATTGEQTGASDTARLGQPVTGSIIRPYAPGSNEGVDFGAPAGAPVRAAEAGTVAAITEDANQVSVIILRHSDRLLTVYANVDAIAVERGTTVSRGQQIAEVGAGAPSFLHFEVIQGAEQVDPVPYLAP